MFQSLQSCQSVFSPGLFCVLKLITLFCGHPSINLWPVAILYADPTTSHLGVSGGVLLLAAVIICLVVVVLRVRRRASYHVKTFEDGLTKGPPNATNPNFSTGEQIDLCGTLAEDC